MRSQTLEYFSQQDVKTICPDCHQTADKPGIYVEYMDDKLVNVRCQTAYKNLGVRTVCELTIDSEKIVEKSYRYYDGTIESHPIAIFEYVGSSGEIKVDLREPPESWTRSGVISKWFRTFGSFESKDN